MINKSMEIINKNGINLIEYYILSTVHGETPVNINLAEATYELSKGDPRGGFELEEYELAVESCIEMGWIKNLTAKDYRSYKIWYKKNMNKIFKPFGYNKGDIDFSWKGAKLYYKIDKELCQSQGRKQFQGTIIYNWWKKTGILSVICPYENDIYEQLQNIDRVSAYFFNNGEEILSINQPYQIESWWINRFIKLSFGYKFDIEYKPNNAGKVLGSKAH